MSFHRTLSLLGLVLASLSVSAQQAERKPYIVQLADSPLASYSGSVAGYPATQPPPGAKLNVNAASVQAYLAYLEAQRNKTLQQVAGARVLHKFNVAFNGFSALLTPAEVQKLQATPGVVAVTPDEPRAVDTSRTPGFLGLSGPGGLWSQVDAAMRQVKGEDVIVGIVDTGISPEDPAFSDKVDGSGKPVPSHQSGTVVYGAPPAKWKGGCQVGEGFSTALCNNKLIGAKHFDAAFRSTGLTLHPIDYASARDADGHGTHTASTAAGNSGVAATINGAFAGHMSGMAPRARVAAYKVCWTYVAPGEPSGMKNSCFTSDSVAAIDAAVADGVDVINFSISGTRTNFLDPVEVAFFNASSAGVFVAASAGNSGPGNTVAHMSPWLTTVAASTHDRLFSAKLTLGNGTQYTGPSLSQGLGTAPLVRAVAAARAGVAAADAARCFPGTLEPALVTGKIVVCDRGANARVEKSEVVKLAGGVGMVLVNVPGGANDTVDDPHFVPSVHLPNTDYAAIHAYAAQAGASASIGTAAQTPGVVAPVMAGFSSRGPNLANANVLKPDITAPGVAILASYAYHPASQAERDAIGSGAMPAPPAAAFLQGTSMSSPHIAGVAALMKQLRPTWSPAAIKSALMTTASAVKLPNGSVDTNRWGYGAGHVDPNAAARVSLVYDAGPVDYLRFLCGVGSLSGASTTCQNVGSIAPYNLNLPSMTAEVLGRATLQRRVTNTGNATANFVASASLPGFTVEVVPSQLSLAPGQTGQFEVRLARTTAPAGSWSFGELSWSNGVQQVRSPLSAKGSLIAAPSVINETRAAGAKLYPVGTGYAGTLALHRAGLLPAVQNIGTVTKDTSTCFDFNVPAGALHARFALYDADTSGGSQDDLDLEVYRGSTRVGYSGGVTTNELVDLALPAAGAYKACVVGYAPRDSLATFKLSSWVINPGDLGGNFRAAAPTRAVLGGSSTVALTWNVAAGQRHFGVVQYKDETGSTLATTLVSVDTSAAAVAEASAAGRKAVARGGR